MSRHERHACPGDRPACRRPRGARRRRVGAGAGALRAGHRRRLVAGGARGPELGGVVAGRPGRDVRARASARSAPTARPATPAAPRGWRCGSRRITSTSAATTRSPSAWLRRAEYLVADLEPCPEHGYNLLLAADLALLAHGDPATATTRSERGDRPGEGDRGRRRGGRGPRDPGQRARRARRRRGGAARGSTSARRSRSREDFDQIVAPGWALCHTVSVCTNVGDFARAGQWCRALHTWSERWRGQPASSASAGPPTATSSPRAATGATPRRSCPARSEDMSTTRPARPRRRRCGSGRLRASQGDRAGARELFESALPLPGAVLALGELDLDGGRPSAGGRRRRPRAAQRRRGERAGALPGARAPGAARTPRRATPRGDSDGADELEREARGSARATCAGARRLVRGRGAHRGRRPRRRAPCRRGRCRPVRLLRGALRRGARAARCSRRRCALWSRRARGGRGARGARHARPPARGAAPRTRCDRGAERAGDGDPAARRRGAWATPRSPRACSSARTRCTATSRTSARKLRTPSRAAAVAYATAPQPALRALTGRNRPSRKMAATGEGARRRAPRVLLP